MVTHQTIFSLCGKLIGHLPVYGWLRTTMGMIKRRANAVTRGWDDTTEDAPLRQMVRETIARMTQSDPSQGPWCTIGQDINVWVDISSFVTGVLLECDDVVFEDACWLRPANDAQHINLAELDMAPKGIDLPLQWKCKVMHLKTDSVSGYHWLVDTLTGKTRVHTKATSEMLLRRQLETIKSLAEEYGLSMDVTLIPSIQNLADPMTQIPQR